MSWEIDTASKAYHSITNSTAFLNIWEGAVSSGKTVASIIRWLHFLECQAPRDGQLLMIGKSLDTLRRNILEPTELEEPAFSFSIPTRKAYYAGRVIQLVGANDARSENKIRGMTVSGAYCDEVTLISADFFNMLVSRLRVEGAMLFGTTNPDSPSHWLKTGFIDNDEIDIRTFHFEMSDNQHLTPKYLAQMEKMYTGLWHKRFILGQWVAAEGAVYDMFGDHLIKSCSFIPKAHIVGVDYGTQNACVFLLIATDYHRAHVIREYYYSGRAAQRSKTDAQYADDLTAFIAGIKNLMDIFIDPSAASFIAECRNRALPVRKAKNDVIEGIQLGAKLFSEGRLSIDPDCERTIKEHYGYSWETKAYEKGGDAVVKIDDHTCDALRYGLMGLRHFFR